MKNTSSRPSMEDYLILHRWGSRWEVLYAYIATQLEKLGIRTATGKTNWQPEVIHRMLKKPVYIGQVNFRMTHKVDGKVTIRPKEEWIIVEDAHEAIIDEETWWKTQNRLQETKGKLPVNVDFSPCELASLISCGKCGKKMVRQYSVQLYEKKNGEKSRYEKEFLRCMCGVYVKYRAVENRLLEILEQYTLDQNKLVEGVQSVMQAPTSEEVVNKEKLLQQVEQQRESIQRKMDRAYELVLDRTFSKEEFEDRRAKYQAELEELERRVAYLDRHEEKQPQLVIDHSRIQANISSVIDAYKRLNSKTRKNVLLNRVFDGVELHITEKGRGRRPTTFDLYIRLKFDVF